MYINSLSGSHSNNTNYTGINLSKLFNKKTYIDKFNETYKKFNPDIEIGAETVSIPQRYFNIKKPHKFKVKENNVQNSKYIIEFNPSKTGQLQDRNTLKPIDVFVLKTYTNLCPNDVTFHFISKDLQQSYGYVSISRCRQPDGITVNWLQNRNPEEISKVGELADRTEAKYCKENNIPLNIVSDSVPEALIAHYKRGKRFEKPRKNSYEYKFLKRNYGITSWNAIFKRLVKKSEETGENIDLSSFKNCSFNMYLPKSLAEKYANE